MSNRRFKKCAFAAAIMILLFHVHADAQVERLIHSFGENGLGTGDGSLLYSGLTPDSHGNLFGVTYYGGAYGAGTAFELSPPAQGQTAWTETVIHSFQPFATADGSFPTAGVTFDKSGNLYGTTSAGGASYLGAVYELSPPASSGTPWTEALVYSFAPHGSGTTGKGGGGATFVHGNLYVLTAQGVAAMEMYSN